MRCWWWLLIALDASLFTVDQTQQVLITQFGDPVRVITQPGLHVKTPFVQTVIPFDKRLLTVEFSPRATMSSWATSAG